MAAAETKISWADDAEFDGDAPTKPTPAPAPAPAPELGIIEDSVDENGVRTVVEYLINDDGKRVKVTRKTKRVLQKSMVDHNVAERKTWAKFGLEKGSKPGPDRATTTVGEFVGLKISAGKQNEEPEQSAESQMKANLARAGAGKVVCRLCKGDHFTAKCPYKETLAGLDSADAPPPEGDDDVPAAAAAGGAAAGGATGSRYVPPSLRNRGPGERMPGAGGAGGGGMNRDDLPTLRVTNISEDVEENDLRDLFGAFGRVARVYVGRDRETGAGKGFAFVSFEDKEVAKRAMEKLHGRGYDNLILSVQWSQPREQK